MTTLRRAAAVLTASVAVALAAAPSAPAAPTPSPSSANPITPALYGTGDPTFDGVWRQSLALLALRTVGVRPSPAAVDWLIGQQCPDGGFPSYRVVGPGGDDSPRNQAAAKKACARRAQDTNASAAAIEALTAVGQHTAQVTKATQWLSTVQNKDGGWSFNPGTPSDANSTAVVIGALATVGQGAASTARDGRTALDALTSFQLGCDQPAGQRGSFAYQPDKKGTLLANDNATAAAALAALGSGFVVSAPAKDRGAPQAPACAPTPRKATGDQSAQAAAAYLVARLHHGGQHLPSPQKGAGPDFSATATAATALAAGGHRAAAGPVMDWLTRESGDWVKGQPAALAQLILAVRATGRDPRDLAGADLVRQLTNLGPKPVSVRADRAETDEVKADKKDDKGGLSVWFTVGVGLLIGIGGGYLISVRKNAN